MQHDTITLYDYLAVVRRRKLLLIATSLIIMAAGFAVALGLPSLYRSTATILIEQQEIPQDLVRSTVTSDAGQRVQLISQRVMSTENLLRIMNKYDLYPKRRGPEPAEAILGRMRDDIKLDMVTADTVDPRSGRMSQVTIAFTISYQSTSPELSRDLANELASLYLNESLNSRRQRAAETSAFLAEEAEKLKREVSALELRLAAFKERNVDKLPEMAEINLQLMDRVEREIIEGERQIRAQEQNRIYLRSQLAQLEPTRSSVMTPAGERLLGPEDQLKVLEAQYLSLSARYAPGHPDVVRARNEIAALRGEVESDGLADELRSRLAATRAKLATARQKYSPEHPDVKRLVRTAANLESELAKVKQRVGASVENPNNPAYIDVDARLEAADADLATLRVKQQELRRKLASYDARLTHTPQVEREYRTLARDYENAQRSYREVKSRQLEAQLAESLETERKGERFTLIDAARLPQSPIAPNRMAIALLGLVLSVGGGVAAAALAEAMDRSVHGVKGVSRLLGEPPLAVIPHIRAPGAWARGTVTYACLAVVLVLGVASIAWLWAPSAASLREAIAATAELLVRR